MNGKKLQSTALVTAAGLAAVIGSIAIADQASESKAPAQPEMKLPPGWTPEDMQACMMAGTPGKMQELLAKDVGVWEGNNTMWMGPGTEPMKSKSTSKVTGIFDGRFIKLEMTGDMPGMGLFKGMGISGFDNVSQKFVSTWIDNRSTGIMTGTGKLSPDGKTLTWNYTFNCPVTKKPVVMREIDTVTGPNTKTLEMFGPDPKTGKEYKMMRIELTKKEGSARAGG